jgi:hypothetical protein
MHLDALAREQLADGRRRGSAGAAGIAGIFLIGEG